MKKSFYVVCAFIVALFTGCEKDIENPYDPGESIANVTYVGDINVGQTGGTTFTKNSVGVTVNKTDNQTLQILMSQVKFSDKMPITLDMTIPGVSYTVSDETINISGNNIIPLAMGGEFPSYTITNLTGKLEKGILTMSMTLGGTYPMTYSGNIQAK